MTYSNAGDINLRVPVSLESSLDLNADSVSVDKQLDTKSLVFTESNGQHQVTGINTNTLFCRLVEIETFQF